MSRNGTTGAFGKCTDLVKLDIDLESKEALVALAVLSGKPLAEYIRDLLHIHVHGNLAVLRKRSPVRE